MIVLIPIRENEKIVINDYCVERIKSNLLGGVKTEAILVFTRTVLERLFKKLDQEKNSSSFGTQEDTKYIYDNLQNLMFDLQQCVVNVEYLIEMMQKAKQYPTCQELRQLAKYEEPLILYNDCMAKRMHHHFPKETSLMPEFLVVCILSLWFLENEKSTAIYSFIEKYDFLLLIEKFERYAQTQSSETTKQISKMHTVSFDMIEQLKKVQYKFNSSRTSKKRKRK